MKSFFFLLNSRFHTQHYRWSISIMPRNHLCNSFPMLKKTHHSHQACLVSFLSLHSKSQTTHFLMTFFYFLILLLPPSKTNPTLSALKYNTHLLMFLSASATLRRTAASSGYAANIHLTKVGLSRCSVWLTGEHGEHTYSMDSVCFR